MPKRDEVINFKQDIADEMISRVRRIETKLTKFIEEELLDPPKVVYAVEPKYDGYADSCKVDLNTPGLTLHKLREVLTEVVSRYNLSQQEIVFDVFVRGRFIMSVSNIEVFDEGR